MQYLAIRQFANRHSCEFLVYSLLVNLWSCLETVLCISAQWVHSAHISHWRFQAFARFLGLEFATYHVSSLYESLDKAGGESITRGNPHFFCFLCSFRPCPAPGIRCIYNRWTGKHAKTHLFISSKCGIMWLKVFCHFNLNFLMKNFVFHYFSSLIGMPCFLHY